MTDSGPKLVEHDLEDIMNSEPVTLPTTRTMQHQGYGYGSERMERVDRMDRGRMSPENGGSANTEGLLANPEAYQAVNGVIAQVFNTDTQTSITALSQLDELMKHSDKVELLAPCVDHLFSMCNMQYRYVLQSQMQVDNAQSDKVIKQLQYLTMVLMSLYGHRDIVKKASTQVLHDLIHVIVCLLLEPKVSSLPEGGQLVRALNVITVKIVDRSEHNAVTSALVKLLHECIGSSVLTNKYTTLVMKCIWKVIRALPSWLEEMDVSLLLADLHSFLISFPGSYWKQQADDTPMRTVKTVIHTLVKVQGASVLQCLNRNMRPGGRERPGTGDGPSDMRARLAQARVNGGGGGLPRPMSGAFSLDLDKIEGRLSSDRQMTDSGPKLVEHDLEDIMNSEPVTLPTTRTMQHQGYGYGSERMERVDRMDRGRMSPENGGSANTEGLLANPEAYQAVNGVIAQVFNTDTQTSITALSQLDELMKHSDKVELLAPCVDHLFSMCNMQYRYVLQSQMQVDNAQSDKVIKQLQYLTMVLMSLYGHRDIVKKASTQVLHDLIHVIVCLLLEPKVSSLPEGGQLVRALNVITVKIVDRSEHNAVTSALVKLLHECIGSSVLTNKYTTLVMKCIWKVIRALPSWLEEMDVSLLLADLHSFLISFPGSYWKQQADDTPMRTVKTVIHTLVKVQGASVLQCLNRLDDPSASELVPYIRKLLGSGVGQDSTATVPQGHTPHKPQFNQSASVEKKKMPRFSQSDHETLVDIFKKIGQKELTKVGLQELYNFKVENPHVDLEPFLAQSSQYFRDYIERGLRKIEDEVKGRGTKIGVVPGVRGVSSIPAPRQGVLQDNTQQGGGGSLPQHLVYLEKLKRLRAAGGLTEPIDQENVENFAARNQAPSERLGNTVPSSASSGYGTGYGSARTMSGTSNSNNRNYRQVEAEPPNENTDNQEENRNNAVPNVDEIRKRLAKIKAQAF